MSELILTRREEQVIRLVVLGKRNASIAEALGIGEQTVKNHLHSATTRNGMTKVQIAIALTGGSLERTEPIRHPTAPKVGSACPLCNARFRLDDGYHEIADPDALGGTRWVRCSAAA